MGATFTERIRWEGETTLPYNMYRRGGFIPACFFQIVQEPQVATMLDCYGTAEDQRVVSPDSKPSLKMGGRAKR